MAMRPDAAGVRMTVEQARQMLNAPRVAPTSVEQRKQTAETAVPTGKDGHTPDQARRRYVQDDMQG